MSEHAFYVPGARWAQDGAVLVDGVWRGQFSPHKGLADYPPGTEVLELGVLAARVEALCCTEPVEIDADRFNYLLEVLPPLGWVRRVGAESFKLSEFTNGRVTCVAVRVGSRYFSFEGVASTPHDECVAKVCAAFGLS